MEVWHRSEPRISMQRLFSMFEFEVVEVACAGSNGAPREFALQSMIAFAIRIKTAEGPNTSGSGARGTTRLSVGMTIPS